MACVLWQNCSVLWGGTDRSWKWQNCHPINQLPITAICASQLQSHRLQSVLTVLSKVTVWQYIEAKGPTYVQCLPLPSAHHSPFFTVTVWVLCQVTSKRKRETYWLNNKCSEGLYLLINWNVSHWWTTVRELCCIHLHYGSRTSFCS